MGINTYFLVSLLNKKRWFTAMFAPTLGGMLAAVFMVSCLWELTEFYMETGYVNAWLTHWLQGVEHPLNRLVADPLMMILGAMVASRCMTPWLVPVAARLFSLAWLYLHLFMLEDSMKLQEALDGFVK